MGKECVVAGCFNRDNDRQNGLKFHRIPKESERRMLWLNAINRMDPVSGKPWVPRDDGARVCSDHFIQGKCDDPASPDYVPTVNLGYKTPLRNLDRYNRVANRSAQKENNFSKRRLPFPAVPCASNASDAADALLELCQIESPTMRENSDPSRHDTCLKMLAESNLHMKQLMQELERLQVENEELKHTRQGLRYVHLKEEEVIFLTGLPSVAVFKWLSALVLKELPKSQNLEEEDILLLTLMKLRLNPPNKDISVRFGISVSSVSCYLDQCIPLLAEKLSFLIRWPEREELINSRPHCFKDSFPNCVSIIDCTEVFIECPANFEARNETYSNYKHTHTIKFLVSITPAGCVSFLSRAFAGKTSDKVLTLESGYLKFLQRGDVVLADRGFLIEKEINEVGGDLVIPAFTRGKSQLSARDVERGRTISNVRIHIERAMERLKNFRILSDRMHINMVPHADSLITICAAVMNLHPCLVG